MKGSNHIVQHQDSMSARKRGNSARVQKIIKKATQRKHVDMTTSSKHESSQPGYYTLYEIDPWGCPPLWNCQRILTGIATISTIRLALDNLSRCIGKWKILEQWLNNSEYFLYRWFPTRARYGMKKICRAPEQKRSKRDAQDSNEKSS